MPQYLYFGNYTKGQRTDRTAFNIDNDAFPVLYNAFSWRGRAKRKRGTEFIDRFRRQVTLSSSVTHPWQGSAITLSGGAGNLVSATISNITQAAQAVVTISGGGFLIGDSVSISGVVGMTQINGGPYTVVAISGTTITINVNSLGFTPYASGGLFFFTNFLGIVPGTISITVAGNTYTEPSNFNGTLIGTPTGTGTINYATGAITIAGGGSNTVTGTFSYYPGLPALGLQDYQLNQPETTNPTTSALFPVLLGFDQQYSYQVNQSGNVPTFYNVNFYKTTGVPFTWAGQDFQLFWTTNYSGALWATNNDPGMNFLNGTFVSGSPGTTITFNFKNNGVNFPNLIIGDVLWFNEWTGGSTINGVTGTVSNVAGAAIGNYGVTFSASVTVSSTGIAQSLTNTIPGKDGIRWYDGDPTGATGIPTGTGMGWVNFAPPLTAGTVSIDNLTVATYYLVGALAIVPFKDRLIFFSPWIQTSAGSPIQLIDTALWSWNGTPYYTVNASGAASLVPAGETANVKAFYVDQTGLGGYLPAGISQPIKTVSNNEDVLLVGFGGDGRKTRFVYTGNDLQPFLFFTINSELPSFSTFSSVALDRGAIDIGQYGIAMTDQQTSQRIDLDIPDSVFEIQTLNNGADRVNAIRDYFRELIYFSYPVAGNIDSENFPNNSETWRFPTQTFLFNYRDNTWALFYENFTVHGYFRPQISLTWGTLPYNTWSEWNTPWSYNEDNPLSTDVIAGTPQGYVMKIGLDDTEESISGYITSISNSTGNTQINSLNHCVADGDYLYISALLDSTVDTITGITLGTTTTITVTNSFVANQYVFIGNVGGTTQLNGNVYQVMTATGAQIVINVNSTNFGTYTSGGTVQSSTNPSVQQVIETIDANNFVIDLPFPTNITYIGLGNFTRLSLPLIQTKQYPIYWEEGRQVRLGPQRYLMETTANGQVTVNIYLSQDPNDAWNSPLNPEAAITGQEFSQILYTCPESTNLGLTPANVNLNMPIGAGQSQIWHRLNTSLQGDSVQIGITLSDTQMRNLAVATSEIILHGMVLQVDRGPLLA